MTSLIEETELPAAPQDYDLESLIPPQQVHVQVVNLAKTFQVHAQGRAIHAFARVSFSLSGGQILALQGPSGAGKSSVLKCLYRNYQPTAGHAYLQVDEARCDLAACDEHAVLRERAHHLGFITQFLHCLPRKSAREVVSAPLIQQRVRRDQALARAEELLAGVHIPHRLWDLPPATFSGGEQQRINIARGLIMPRALLLVDEPTASLDRESAEAVLVLIKQARDHGSAVVGIWHDPAIVDAVADQVVAVAPGE